MSVLAARVSAILKFGVGVGEDPFPKVKGLITDLIHKSCSDEKMLCTAEKKQNLESEVARSPALLRYAVKYKEQE